MPRPPSPALVAVIALAIGMTGLVGCASLPGSGPSGTDLVGDPKAGASLVQVIELNPDTVRQRASLGQPRPFSDALDGGPDTGRSGIGKGDVLEIHLWEAPPATLFGGGAVDLRNPSTARTLALPEQVVDRDGTVSVPFIGRIVAVGKTPAALGADIARQLRGKANQPEAMVRVVRNASALVTVVGEVQTSVRMPLTPGGERLLDALAAAGGVRQPVHKTTVQVTRGNQTLSMPLDRVIRDPRQNVPLHAGDVVTALFQPLSFTALGATGKNEEVAFEAQGISLAQALARVGGVQDGRADAQGVFVFRLEPPPALPSAQTTTATTADGRVPVVYRLQLRDPRSFFLMQDFQIQDKDVVYVSNAPAAELQKFLNLVFSVAYPVLTTIQVTR